MILRRPGGGDEAYYTYVEEADDDAIKNSALIGSAFPAGERILLNGNFLTENFASMAIIPLEVELVEIDGNQRRYTLFLHCYAEERVGNLHRALVMRNHDHL